MAYSSLSSTLIAVAKPTKKEIFTTLKSNQDDHETRIASVESGSASKIILFNEIIELDRSRTGDVKFSLLTESQYQAKFGVDWELIKGQSISGSDLASLYGATLPDARDRFPRILASSGKTVGQTETSQNKSHTHYIQDSGGKQIAKDTGSGGVNADRLDSTNANCWTAGLQGQYIPTLSDGGTEARPDSIILNAFTRKDDYEIDQVRLFKAPYAFTFTSCIITTLVAGSAGTLEVDVLKGTTLGSLTTVFSTKPSVSYSSGNNTSSSNAVFSTTSVSSGDWIQLDITSLQTKQNRFQMYLIGEV
jgi:hypothetical protein